MIRNACLDKVYKYTEICPFRKVDLLYKNLIFICKIYHVKKQGNKCV